MTAVPQTPLREWGVYRKVSDTVRSGLCGQLCSLRWTWLTRSGEDTYVGILAGLLDVSRELAGGKLTRLHIEPVYGMPICFALAEFQGGVVAEFEINERLPDSVPDARFLMADFSGGRVTNRPLTGFHHGEGAFLATKAGAGAVLFEPMPVIDSTAQDTDLTAEIMRVLRAAKS